MTFRATVCKEHQLRARTRHSNISADLMARSLPYSPPKPLSSSSSCAASRNYFTAHDQKWPQHLSASVSSTCTASGSSLLRLSKSAYNRLGALDLFVYDASRQQDDLRLSGCRQIRWARSYSNPRQESQYISQGRLAGHCSG
ncbi:hypothetical protein PoB_006623800 [Plakobranchus ocellatus]|uniref:Uncharacterized protein n=1 Tax=Plakobranchus ocellatus TaxID=259542 RepID=A0AAV4D689_9GAST|nr:hypothetical protein PoB_006623800 [Plakobranchus ocellatus]